MNEFAEDQEGNEDDVESVDLFGDGRKFVVEPFTPEYAEFVKRRHEHHRRTRTHVLCFRRGEAEFARVFATPDGRYTVMGHLDPVELLPVTDPDNPREVISIDERASDWVMAKLRTGLAIPDDEVRMLVLMEYVG